MSTTTRTTIINAYEEGLLVELDLANGKDYAGYEVEEADPHDEGFLITYGDYPDEREENAVWIRYDEVVAVEVI